MRPLLPLLMTACLFAAICSRTPLAGPATDGPPAVQPSPAGSMPPRPVPGHVAPPMTAPRAIAVRPVSARPGAMVRDPPAQCEAAVATAEALYRLPQRLLA